MDIHIHLKGLAVFINKMSFSLLNEVMHSLFFSAFFRYLQIFFTLLFVFLRWVEDMLTWQLAGIKEAP